MDEQVLYERAVGIMVTTGRASTSYIQRKLEIGYNKAARLVERAQEEGIISSANHVGKRDVIIKAPGAPH